MSKICSTFARQTRAERKKHVLIGEIDMADTKKIYQEVKSFIEDSLSVRRATYYKGEKAVEKEIIKQMQEHFGSENVDSQHSVGGFLNLKCDIDLFDGMCGIELKVTKDLEKATVLQRVLGQVFYYSQRQYNKSSLVLLIIGTATELNPKLKELKDFVEQIEGVHFIYKQVAKKQEKDATTKASKAVQNETAPNAPKDTNIFYCKSGLCYATGILLDDGFLVYKGSALRTDVRSSAKPAFIKQRKQFIEQNCHIVNGVPITLSDYKFSSPSTAAAMFLGGNANGWTEWKNEEGKTLSKIYRKK